MKKIVFTIGLFALLILTGQAQNISKGKIITEVKGKGFYIESILKDVTAVEEKQTEKEPYKRFVMDQSGMDLPNKIDLYKTAWSNKTQSQGNAGTCWSFSTKEGENLGGLFCLLRIHRKSPPVYRKEGEFSFFGRIGRECCGTYLKNVRRCA